MQCVLLLTLTSNLGINMASSQAENKNEGIENNRQLHSTWNFSTGCIKQNEQFEKRVARRKRRGN